MLGGNVYCVVGLHACMRVESTSRLACESLEKGLVYGFEVVSDGFPDRAWGVNGTPCQVCERIQGTGRPGNGSLTGISDA